jgi:hypothetical protein
LVERSLYALSPFTGPSSEVFLPPPSPRKPRFTQLPALEVYLSFRVHPKVPPLSWPKPESRPPPMEFLPLQRITTSGVHITRVYLARFVPPTGFLTLLTAFSSHLPPGPVSCRNALGVPPSRGFPSQGAAHPPRMDNTLLAFSPARCLQPWSEGGGRPLPRHLEFREGPFTRLQGLALPKSPFAPGNTVKLP